MAKNTHRDPNGRYTHQWGWQGFDKNGAEWQMCNHCEKWMRNGIIVRHDAPELRPSPDAWKAEINRG